jgi:hypothetical protein
MIQAANALIALGVVFLAAGLVGIAFRIIRAARGGGRDRGDEAPPKNPPPSAGPEDESSPADAS